MSRAIVHLDADAFFASVEQAADPRLRGKPIAVGGEKRGIIASASYEARRFGVYTPMPTVRARKLCPKLVVLPGDFERYEQFSRWMFSYAYDFTPEVEETSIDEGYFDVTGSRKSAGEIAQKVRQAIRQSLKITVSEGIGANKLVSQIASKLHKPAALEEVAAGREIQFLHPLPNQWLPGVGPKTSVRLCSAGLARIGQIAATPLDLLEVLMGNTARTLRDFSNGIDERPLVPVRVPQKSFSEQETFARDLTDEEYLAATLRRMADRLFAQVREEHRSVRTLTVKVRYNDMAEDQCSESLIEPTDLETDVYTRLETMLRDAWKRRVSLRLVSLKLSNVYDGRFRSELTLDGPAQRQNARERLAAAVDELRRAKGHAVFLRGHDFRLRQAPREAGANIAERGCVVHDQPQQSSNIATVPASSRSEPSRSPDRGDTRIAQGGASPRWSRRSEAKAEAEPRLTARKLAPLSPVRGGEGRERGPSPNAQPTKKSSPVYHKLTTGYLPLRAHSYYSFLDSTLSPSRIVDLAAKQGMSAVALTDTGNLHGVVEFVLAAKRAGVKPIIGVELTFNSKPLLLYVENTRGYHNLCRLLTRHGESSANNAEESAVAARQRRPIRRQELEGLTEGLLAVSDDAELAALFPGRFYRLAGSPESSHSAVACPDIRHATPRERAHYDMLQSIRTLTLLEEKHPEKRRGGRYHFRGQEEMKTACREHPDWLRHTEEIAGRCAFELPFGKPQFPAYAPADSSTARNFLQHLVLQGLQERYGSRAPKHRAQVMEELEIIGEVGYEEYFLITWDFLQDCRRRGIEWITRGSAADSLVCYCLGISGVCPIRFDLYFRRFLNRDRMALQKLPDIDIDFAHDLKDEVVKLIFEKYGREHCAVVGGFSTFQARSAFAEAAKVLGVAEREVRRFTDHFPWSFGGGWVPSEHTPSGGAKLLELLRASPENRDLPIDEEPYRTALELAELLDGAPRYPKMHPCGLVLSRQPMTELTPTFIANKGYTTTHFDMDAVEAVGLVKMDILAQGGLAAMRDTRESLKKRGISIDLEKCVARSAAVSSSTSRSMSAQDQQSSQGRLLLGNPDAPEPWGDPAVWQMIAGGGARAVHHIESPAMTSLNRMCNVGEIDGLIAIVSVIRPGAANEGKKVSFTRRYQGLEEVTYPDPCLERCLRSTYGLVVYEEHILQMSEAFAGLAPGRADVLRRALNKQNRPVMEKIRGEFFAAALARGRTPEKTGEVWGLVTGFAGYAFCKAHSTAYGVEAYQAAWLKRYFPAEFMAAVLSNGKGFYDPLVYVLECHRLGIPLLPPTVNQPGPGFQVVSSQSVSSSSSSSSSSSFPIPHSPLLHPSTTPSSPQCIRVPLSIVKGMTERTLDRIWTEHERAPFASLGDFYRRVGPSGEEMEALLRVGAFDEFGQKRTAQFWEIQFLRRSYGEAAGSGQGWLWAAPGLERLPEAPLTEPTRAERLEAENELLGYPVSGHPLERYGNIAWDTYCPVSQLGEHVGEEVVTCGLVVEQRVHHQITGEPMKFLTLADWTGMVETELFAATYRSYGLATVRYPVLEITARVEGYENGRGFSLRAMRAGRPRTQEG